MVAVLPVLCTVFLSLLFQDCDCVKLGEVPLSPKYETCDGLDCMDVIWCRRFDNFVDVSRIWSQVTFSIVPEVAENSEFTPCIISGSEDSALSKESFLTKNITLFETMQLLDSPPLAQKLLSTLNLHSNRNEDGSYDYHFSPYKLSCIKVCPGTVPKGVSLKVSATRVDKNMYYPSMLLVGTFLILCSRYLSEKIVFYYATGTSLGVMLSVFLITYFVVRKLQPRGGSPYFGILLATVAQSMIGTLGFVSDWLKDALNESVEMLVYYVVASAIISLGVTHYYLRGEDGVGVSAGLKDVTRWSINLIGIGFISRSSASVFWSLVICTVTLVLLLVTGPILRFVSWFRRAVLRLDDIPALSEPYVSTPFITMEQYKLQGEIVTESSLEKLVSTPEFKEWARKNIERISVTPLKRELDFEQD